MAKYVIFNIALFLTIVHASVSGRPKILIKKNEMAKYVIFNIALFLTIVHASNLLTNEWAERMSAAICKFGSGFGNL